MCPQTRVAPEVSGSVHTAICPSSLLKACCEAGDVLAQPRAAVAAPGSLAVSKARLDGAWSSLGQGKVSLPMAGDWNKMNFMATSHPDYLRTLQSSVFNPVPRFFILTGEEVTLVEWMNLHPRKDGQTRQCQGKS